MLPSFLFFFLNGVSGNKSMNLFCLIFPPFKKNPGELAGNIG